MLPPDGKPVYRGKIEMSIERLPTGVVLLYLTQYNPTTTKVAEKQTLTIGEPGTLYAANETLAAEGTVLKTKRGEMYQLKHFSKFDLPVSRLKPDPIKHVTCTVTSDAASGYELSCRTDKTQ
jgi:hypothetical protein